MNILKLQFQDELDNFIFQVHPIFNN